MKQVHIERLKALTGMLHNLAVVSISGGMLLPVVAKNLTNRPHFGYLTTIPVGLLLVVRFGAMGQMILGDLRE